MRRLALGLAAAVTALAIPACTSSSEPGSPGVPGGRPDRAPDIMRAAGCATCHAIPGVRDADADVGPPLDRWSRREYVAGRLTNTPEHLLTWLLDPQEVDPRTAMPDVGLTEQEAKDIAAYLYGLD